ncbi:hypothetical protein Scep_017513 [Stephania cephalantha]|uniref:Uncharacterized protein n=1 Tax=Stephania cephalantha TaxID=152367 RepID=A0AAP0IQ82_9MAGN
MWRARIGGRGYWCDRLSNKQATRGGLEALEEIARFVRKYGSWCRAYLENKPTTVVRE